MMQLIVTPSSTLSGSLRVTPSKSHTMRAILLGSLACGTSIIHQFLLSPDTTAMIQACKAMGARIQVQEEQLHITGVCAQPCAPDNVIDVGNSGQVLRFVAAVAALLPQYTVLTGDASICHLRPMQPLLDALQQLGVFAVSTKNDGYAPVIIKGPARAGSIRMQGQDSQPVSAMLFLAALLEGETCIAVENPGERPWIDMTLHWLSKLGVQVSHTNHTLYKIQGVPSFSGFEYTVAGDWSSAAFPLAAAVITNSPVTLENIDMDDPQGDKAFIAVLESLGASFAINKHARQVSVLPHQGLHGGVININNLVDALPILATVACFCSSPVEIIGAAITRHKECDRIHAIAVELGKMGATIEEKPDGLIIYPSTLHWATVNSWHDHRIAMALAVAGLASEGAIIEQAECIDKSFPNFADAMRGIGACMDARLEK